MAEAYSYNIEIEGLPELINKLEASVRDDVINRSLYQGGLLIAGWSKANRLSGPRPQYLGVVTGRLRSSISAAPVEHIGNEYLERIGTNVEYGAIHEFGGATGRNRKVLCQPGHSCALPLKMRAIEPKS